VNKDFVNNIERYYQYAERIAPGYGHDIVHHIATEIKDNVKNIDAYVETCIRNSYRNKKSSFNRLYRPHIYEELADVQEYEYNGSKYDAILLHRIFLEMEMQGFDLHVSVFKDCFLGGSIRKFSERTQIDRRTITKICKFAQNEIIRRYTELDNQ
jgi:hypothetical protein